MKTLGKLSKKQATKICGSLGEPSKMPCHTYSIPAKRCKMGSKLVKIEGSTCARCYALKNNYRFPNVQDALEYHYQSLDHPQWEDALVFLIESTGEVWFRWFDSGDLQSVEHFARICRVVRRTPRVKHWLPTREYKFVLDYLAAGGKIPRNLVVRFSAHMVDAAPPAYGFPTSTVHSQWPGDPLRILNQIPAGTHYCQAPRQGNKCDTCRACWNPRVRNVSYHAH